MKRYPLKEIKELDNEVVRHRCILDFENFKISNFTQFQILKHILAHEGEPINQKDLESVVNIRKSTISGILDTMEKNKIIKRVPSKEDGREKLICLSDEATSFQKEIFESLRSIEESLIEGIDEEDMKVFFKVIDQMRNNLKKKGNDDSNVKDV